MIESILYVLVEIGLLRADIIHQRNVLKEEAADGIKRPVKKYFLQPSIKVFLVVMLVVTVPGIFLITRKIGSQADRTVSEMQEISNAIFSWKERHGVYPQNLEALTEGRPLRQQWLSDEWNNQYVYSVDPIKDTCSLLSVGRDGTLGTADDIKN